MRNVPWKWKLSYKRSIRTQVETVLILTQKHKHHFLFFASLSVSKTAHHIKLKTKQFVLKSMKLLFMMILFELFLSQYACWFTSEPERARVSVHIYSECIERQFNFVPNSWASKKGERDIFSAAAAADVYFFFHFIVQFAFITGPHMFHMRIKTIWFLSIYPPLPSNRQLFFSFFPCSN